MSIQSVRQPARRLIQQCHECGSIRRIEPRRWQSTAAVAKPTKDFDNLESSSFKVKTDDGIVKSYDPVKKASQRKTELPSSRYKFRPPRYYRGPLHPHQPPPDSDPASRVFQPGPFSLTRMQQTYESTVAQDVMTLSYQHLPQGVREPPVGERLRSWSGASPYMAGRPLRAPKGGHPLRPAHRRITFQNIPEIKKVVVHAFCADASDDSAHLHVAGMALQTITNVRVRAHKVRHPVVQWGLKKGKFTSVTAELEREDMHHFLAKLVELVMPKVKDYKGIRWTAGDSTGNVTLGFDPEAVALFPEIEANYDAFPEKMIPGIHVTIQTSAKMDKEARLLLTAMGVPFYGRFSQ